MNEADSSRSENFRWSLALVLLVLVGLSTQGCSQPILESNECVEARDSVKRFYSFHLGNDMTPSKQSLEKRTQYLTQRLSSERASEVETKRDYFTQTDDYPKAFRVGKCNDVGEDRTEFEVLMFWRKNETNIERTILVEALKENSRWLVDKVTSKN